LRRLVQRPFFNVSSPQVLRTWRETLMLLCFLVIAFNVAVPLMSPRLETLRPGDQDFILLLWYAKLAYYYGLSGKVFWHAGWSLLWVYVVGQALKQYFDESDRRLTSRH
jgi:hypothetical protein